MGSPSVVKRDPIALYILFFYALVGAGIYAFYGYRHSRIADQAVAPAD